MADDLDALRALEREFLARGEVPSARVVRRAPRSATDDDERDADASDAVRATSDARDDATAATTTTTTESVGAVSSTVMRDVVERAVGGRDADDDAAEKRVAERRRESAKTGFPEVKHRSETNFGRKTSRFAARKAAMRGGGGGGGGGR